MTNGGWLFFFHSVAGKSLPSCPTWWQQDPSMYLVAVLWNQGPRFRRGWGSPERAAWVGKRAWIRRNLSRILSSQQLLAWDVPRAASVLTHLFTVYIIRLWCIVGVQKSLAEQMIPTLSFLVCARLSAKDDQCLTLSPKSSQFRAFIFFSLQGSPFTLDSSALRFYNSIILKLCYSKIPWFHGSPHEPWTSAFILDPRLD